ncbi:MAG TPA: MBL fold metallo-hydrolase [Acidimicrobiia bacterium]|nr:MBL fold metallo-hydrolase [Acidimicrobiia bacterium]
MRLTVLGANGTYPTPGRPASGYLVESQGAVVWLDAGPGTFPAALARGVPERVAALVLSHVHADHCSDVLALLNFLRYGPRPRDPLPLLAPEGVVDRLAAFAGAGPDHDFFGVFDVRVVDAGDEATFGHLTITFGAAVHPVPAVCAAVSDGARRIVYSGDTGPGGDLPRLAARAELLLCEATYQGEPGENRYPYHLHAAEAGALARDAAVDRLVLTHIAPTLDTDISAAEAAATFGRPVEIAAPGAEIDV